MIKLFAPLALIALAGCASTTKLVDPPDLVALPDDIASPCPVAPALTDNTLGALALADAALATMYADCKAKHAAAVNAYNTARAKRASYNSSRRKKK